MERQRRKETIRWWNTLPPLKHYQISRSSMHPIKMFLDKHGDGVRIRILIEATTRFSLQVTIFGEGFGFGLVVAIYHFYGSRGMFARQREIEPRCILPPQVASSIFQRILFYRALEEYRIIDSALPLFTPVASWKSLIVRGNVREKFQGFYEFMDFDIIEKLRIRQIGILHPWVWILGISQRRVSENFSFP